MKAREINLEVIANLLDNHMPAGHYEEENLIFVKEVIDLCEKKAHRLPNNMSEFIYAANQLSRSKMVKPEELNYEFFKMIPELKAIDTYNELVDLSLYMELALIPGETKAETRLKVWNSFNSDQILNLLESKTLSAILLSKSNFLGLKYGITKDEKSLKAKIIYKKADYLKILFPPYGRVNTLFRWVESNQYKLLLSEDNFAKEVFLQVAKLDREEAESSNWEETPYSTIFSDLPPKAGWRFLDLR